MYEYNWSYIVFLKYIFIASYHTKWKEKTGKQCIDQISDRQNFLVLVRQENRKSVCLNLRAKQTVSYLETGMLQNSLQISILV
jgi:hypothetical protein